MTKTVKIIGGRPTVNAGALRHPISSQSYGQTNPTEYDAAGAVSGWSDFLTARAAIEIVRGVEVIRGGQTTTQLYSTVTIWYQPDILPNMRVVVENGSTYVIESIENVLEMNIVLVLNCVGIGVNAA